MVRSSVGPLAAAILVSSLAGAYGAGGGNSLQAHLSSDRLGYIQSGRYLAGEHTGFQLDAQGPLYLLRFDDSPEVFVLHATSASMGGRVLAYDSGETALQVSGWGGITLYTPAAPAGLPAMRVEDSTAPSPAGVSLSDVQNAAQAEAQHWVFTERLDLCLSADWNALSGNPAARAVALEAMDNFARGLDRFAASAKARKALLRRVNRIALVMAAGPAVALDRKTLIVTFDPLRGYEGRASSRAIVRALHVIFAEAMKQS